MIQGVRLIQLQNETPPADAHRRLPATRRVLRTADIDIICFTFSPGQVLGDHHVGHPIIVHCLSGCIGFLVEGHSIRLTAGSILHLDAGITHHLSCPEPSTETAVILLTHLKHDRRTPS
ncbi:hypothetical protein [Corynebacterium pacaense]|uniref:hypothetical protein n=1 Tax=Corynebacterium pacaense TaxID=1816684 RepID=UPI0009BB5E7C|nr:hypothetical protein [Corynebacterium pacaense]